MRRLSALCCVLAAAGCGGGGAHVHADGFGGATWSSGGDRLAYVASKRDQEPTTIYVVSRLGGSPRRLSQPGFDAWSPAWSPDGRTLAYVAGRVLQHPYKLAPDDLYLVSADGRRRVRLTHTAAGESSPSWSPDGRQLVYVRDARLYTIAANGTGARPLAAGPDSEPQWSPDGRWIAYVHGTFGNGELILVRPDGTGARRIGGPGMDCPRWSPRGDRIAYRVYGFVHVVNIRAQQPLVRLVGATDGYSCDYAWSPDGNALVTATLATDGNWQLDAIELVSAGNRRLATIPYDQLGPDLEPAWAPAPTIAIGGDTLQRLDPHTRTLHVLVPAVHP